MDFVQNKKMERPTRAGALPKALGQALGQRVQRLRNEGRVVGGADIDAAAQRLKASRNPQRDLSLIEGNLRGTCPTVDGAVREFRAAQQSTSPEPGTGEWNKFAVGISQIRGR